ncbi:MAG: AsmA family protein [Gammaproteobacteria bacterium]|nr:AsmA family protein [Gammaproteobacteria bacterium]
MMKIFKWLLAGIALLVVLVIVAVGAFLALFDANEYKQNLSDLVQQQTGRSLQFSGDIKLTLYPSLGMKLGAMTFANAPGFGDSPMLAVKNASVSVDVLSLLAFKPQIAQLQLDGLKLTLQKSAQGKTNWDDLVKSSPPAVESDKTATPPAADDAAGFKLEGAFDGLLISNAQLLWKDASTGDEYRVDISQLTTGAIAPDLEFPLQLRMALESVGQLSAQMTLNTRILFKNQVLSLRGLQLETSAAGALIPVDQVSLNLAAEVTFSLPDQRLGVSAFNTRINTRGGVLEKSATTLSGEIGFDLTRQELTVGVLDLQSELHGEAVPNGQLKAALSASKLELLLEKRALKLDDLVLALNENRFKGFLQLLDYQRPDVRFELSSERFDLDKLLGASITQPEVPAPQPEEAPAADVQISLPMELLRNLRLDGRLAVASLIAQGLTLNDIVLKMTADKGIVRLDPFTMNLYQGSFVSAIQINAQADKPVYTVSKQLTGFKIGKFLTDFMGDSMLYGETDLNLHLTAEGEWLSALKSSLNGDLSLALKDGSVKGINIRHSIDSARAKLRREDVPELVEKKTDFSALSLSAMIKNGVVSTDDLDMQAPLVRLGGKGTADLVHETVDYLLNAKLVSSFKGQQGGTADELTGLTIPVAIRGSWLSPEIDIQLDEIFKAKLNAKKQQISDALDKQNDALAQKLAAEKASLKATQDKALAEKKAQLELQQQQAEDAKKAELDARKKQEEEKARKKLDEKLKKLF